MGAVNPSPTAKLAFIAKEGAEAKADAPWALLNLTCTHALAQHIALRSILLIEHKARVAHACNTAGSTVAVWRRATPSWHNGATY